MPTLRNLVIQDNICFIGKIAFVFFGSGFEGPRKYEL